MPRPLNKKIVFFDFAVEIINTRAAVILEANAQDTAKAKENGKDKAFIDRLTLNPERLAGMCATLEEIKIFDDPVGKILANWDRPNGLNISRVSTPLGVIGLIFESRPNVASDAGGLCLKSGNAVILRSGKDGLGSALAIVAALRSALVKAKLPEDSIQIVSSEQREAATYMLEGLDGAIDVIVPRGGKSLVAEVETESQDFHEGEEWGGGVGEEGMGPSPPHIKLIEFQMIYLFYSSSDFILYSL